LVWPHLRFTVHLGAELLTEGLVVRGVAERHKEARTPEEGALATMPEEALSTVLRTVLRTYSGQKRRRRSSGVSSLIAPTVAGGMSLLGEGSGISVSTPSFWRSSISSGAISLSTPGRARGSRGLSCRACLCRPSRRLVGLEGSVDWWSVLGIVVGLVGGGSLLGE
jgi:hypothetical protein